MEEDLKAKALMKIDELKKIENMDDLITEVDTLMKGFSLERSEINEMIDQLSEEITHHNSEWWKLSVKLNSRKFRDDEYYDNISHQLNLVSETRTNICKKYDIFIEKLKSFDIQTKIQLKVFLSTTGDLERVMKDKVLFHLQNFYYDMIDDLLPFEFKRKNHGISTAMLSKKNESYEKLKIKVWHQIISMSYHDIETYISSSKKQIDEFKKLALNRVHSIDQYKTLCFEIEENVKLLEIDYETSIYYDLVYIRDCIKQYCYSNIMNNIYQASCINKTLSDMTRCLLYIGWSKIHKYPNIISFIENHIDRIKQSVFYIEIEESKKQYFDKIFKNAHDTILAMK